MRNILEIKGLTFVRGVGSPETHTAGLMSAARIFSGESDIDDDRSDDCSNVSSSIRSLAIVLNDGPYWDSDSQRTKMLLPIVPLLLDTKGSFELEQKRAYLYADYAVRKFAPLALHSVGLKKEAVQLAKLKKIKDEKTSNAAAAAAAYAYLSDDAAKKAPSNAAAAAAAYAYAYAYAFAAIAATTCDASKNKLRNLMVKLLKTACAMEC